MSSNPGRILHTSMLALGLSGALHAQPAPLTSDINTLILYHLDETSGSTVANSATTGGNHGVYSTATGATATPAGLASATGYPGFGNALNNLAGGSRYFGVGVDVSGDGAWNYDGATGADDFNFRDAFFTDPAAGVGAFTFEAMVNVSTLSPGDPQEIWSSDTADGSGTRSFQFRIDQGGTLRFDAAPLGASSYDITFDLSTLSGPHAFAANEWFHVAVTYSYDGVNPAATRLYWTRVSSGATGANLVAEKTGAPMTGFSSSTSANLIFGNEGRTNGGMNEGFQGLLDEGRVSNIARTSDDFIFPGVPVYLMSYHAGGYPAGGRSGVFLSWSSDGLHFSTLNDGQPVFVTPEFTEDDGDNADGYSNCTRDPSIVYDAASRLFRMLWTSDIHSRSFGYADSPDLKNWSHVQLVQMWPNPADTVGRTWAPEWFHDDNSGNYIAVFASDVNGASLRQYHTVMTRNGDGTVSFGPPVELYHEPDNTSTVIDAVITKLGENDYRLASAQHNSIHICSSTTPYGPWGTATSATAGGDEGPAVIRIGGLWHLYYDNYGENENVFGLSTSPDFVTWTDRTVETVMPKSTDVPGYGTPHHGTVFAAKASTLALFPEVRDTDDDGLRDSWETGHFGDLSQNGGGDPDGEGSNNEAEETAGSDPDNAQSFPGRTLVVRVAGSSGNWETANPPGNTLDGNLDTRASAAGDGSHITYSLGGGSVVVESVDIAFFNGDSRAYSFDILVSDDNLNWTTALNGATSSGNSLALQNFDLPTDPTASFLRIVAHGYNGNTGAFNSYTEVAVNLAGAPVSDESDDDGLPDAWEIQYFGSLSQNSYDDGDGDGYNNLEELTAGTSPVVALDHPLWESPRVSLVQDSTATSNARLFANGAAYGRVVNGVSFQDQILLTFDGYQYTAWYDNTTLTVLVARRTVLGTTTGSWEVFNTGSTFVNGVNGDAHNVISLGICATDGTLHMSWDHHGHTLRYRRSVAGLCTTHKAAWGAGMMNAEQNWLVASGQTIPTVTYPLFISAPGGGLAFQWRYGSSGSGDNMLSLYDGTTHAWSTPVQFDSRSGSYVEGAFNSNSRNAYLNGFDFSPDGTMHVTWTYREGAGTSNHDICYAYSTDQGVTWRNNAGDVIADTSLGQTISLTSPGILVKRKNLNQLLINQQAQCVDLDGRVHMLTLHRREDPGYEYPNITTVAYSINGTAYYHYFRDPESGGWSQRRIPPEIAPVGSRPTLGYDADGNLYAAFLTYTNRGEIFPGYRGGHLAIATASKASSYTNWEVVYLSSTKFNGEPLLDQTRLVQDNVLSVFIQEDSSNSSAVGTPLHIVDFTVAPVDDADTDDDGLLDSWETASFGDLSIGNVDFDGDGSSNAEEMVAGSDPANPDWRPTKARLEHRWSFNGSLADSVGGSDATIVDMGSNDAVLGANSVTMAGGVKGSSDYVNLGSNLLSGRMTPVTIELWATQNQVQTWSRIFDFNLDDGENLFMSWSIADDPNSDRVAWKQAPDGETAPANGSNAPYTLGTPWHIVMTITPQSDLVANGSKVEVYSAPAGSGTLGGPRATFFTPYHLAHLNDVVGALGWSPWPDDVASATYDEVRIWEGALTPAELELHQTNGPDLIADPDDLDADGLRDAWETAMFENTTSQNASGDADHDGTTNLTEQRLGLDPNDGSSRFAAALNGFEITWPGAFGVSFKIQRSGDVATWQDLATQAGVVGTNAFTDPAPPADRAFYRVALAP